MCRLNVGMAQHLRHRFDWHTLTECHGRCECVPCQMESYVLVDAAYIGNLLQIAVELLVSDDR